MIALKEPQLFTNKKYGAGLSFKVELRLADGGVYCRINGVRVMGAMLMGPCVFTKTGRALPQVELYALKEDIMRAIEAEGWRRDFPQIQFPEAPCS